MDVKEFIKEVKDLWKLLRKPDKEEIKRTIIVTLVFLVSIGFVGWLIQEIINYILALY